MINTNHIKVLSKVSCVAAAISLQACAVIHFENGYAVPDPQESSFDWSFGLVGEDEPELEYNAESSQRYRRWYHHAIFSFAELSNALQLKVDCAGLEWNQVTTEVTPLDVVLGLADNALLLNASSAALDLWSPWSIEYSCRDER